MVAANWSVNGNGILKAGYDLTKQPPLDYFKLMGDTEIWDALLSNNPRLKKSIQWYIINGREILNAKV